MIKKVLSLALLAILLGNGSLSSQCVNDTVFTDVIYLIDNSGSIDDTEFASFSTLITTSIADLQADCADAQVSVLHYGGFEGKGLAIEHPFSKGVPINTVNRQFCTARSGSFNLCTDGGGDDLNHAIGSIIDSMEAGSLVHDTSNNLSIVILTDAFGFDTNCTQPFCSLILPTTNIDIMKANYAVDVTVVGMSSQAEETALAIYSSPGGTYNGGLNAAACATSFDGCALPRKYLEVDFNSDPNVVAAAVTSFVSCSVIVNTGLTAEAGSDQNICSDLSQSVMLTATPSMGMPVYSYAWSDGAGSSQTVSVSPTTTTTYYVTITDGNTCTAVDSVTVVAAPCCDSFSVNAGMDTTICSTGGSSANLSGVATGGVSPFTYSWDNGLGTGANKTASPTATTTYTVSAIDSIGCSTTDQVTVSVQMCCAGFSVSAGADRSICTDLGGSSILMATITGGVGPYLTVWNNGIGAVTNPVVSPSDTTTYTVTITDASGCITTDDVTVNAAPCCSTFIVNAGLDTTICSDPGSTATLFASATGSGSTFGYSWSDGLGTGESKSVSPTTTTTYTVTATDNIGCITTDQVTVTVEGCCTGFSVSAGADRSICSDFSETTTLTTVITGGVGPYLTVWDNGIGVMTNPIVSPTITTTYNVTITDGSGCITTDDVIVVVDPMCGPDCLPDTTFTDVVFLIDNSGSISDTEFAAFENIIMASLGGIKNSCASSRRSVVHYGGANGTSTVIEYALGQTPEITSINRQYCNNRNGSNICIGGGGDDLNNAIGDIMSFINDGSLNRDIGNKLSLVILTDAFGFDTNCPQPNCSLILPTTNIDLMKANHDVDVSVVGLSSQAEEVLLGIYASPGGTFNSPLYAPECAGSFDGCTLPRKYVQVEFNTPPQDVADMIADFVSCEVEVIPALTVDAGVDQTICGNLGESATLTALGDVGVTPYVYTWSNGLGTSPSVVVSPITTMKYFVTVTDANLCTAIDSVMVNAQECLICDAYAGTPLDPIELCLEGGQALLPTESNDGVVLPMSFEEVFILTNEDLVIIDYSIGHRNFRVNETGLYRIHTLVAEVSNPASPDYLDLSIIIPGTSDLFLIVNCIENHDICADFDFKGRAHFVFGPEDMMCMTFENSISLCMDGIDNDGDGLIDCADEECTALINCTESTLIACNDLTDNDGDGLVDCYDPDCFAFTVCFERGANCNDGIDNDGDGLIDCEDNSCDGAASCIENSPFTCVDGRDNDGDGLVDCADPDCQSFIVCAEYTVEACKDGIDNDFDGLVDCKDTNCRDLLPEYCEPFENTVEKCSDGRDNDFDGLVDCEDPDCITTELIAVLDNLDIILEVTDATCSGGDNGIIRFYGIAQDPSFQYSIDGGQNFISSYQFTALAPRDYVVAIKSALGCVHYLDLNVDREICKEICNNNIDDDEDGLVDCDDNDCNVVDPAGPQIINIQASDCPNYTNGSFEVSGLSPDVTYTIDGGATYQSSKVFTGLGALSYNLGFRDADGCHHGIIVTIPKGSDADDDNICDDVDVCPGVDDWVIGTPCDDGDACTVDDIYNATCDCVGTYLDTDQDGICDLDDICPTADDSLIGTACDDGNPCSTGDIYDTACNCAGVVQDSDGDGICDADDVCPSGDDSLIGTACDDGDACTINDVYNTACNCLGTSTDADFDNVCDSDDVCPGMDDSLIGTACDDGDPCTTGDIFTTACNCAGVYQDSDQDGICDANDECPTLGIAIGSLCDDGNPATENDVITEDCLCLGTVPVVVTEICDNGIDDDGDGLVDCYDNDCCGLLSCSSDRLEYEITNSDCGKNTGKISIINPDSTVHYFITNASTFDTIDISVDTLPVGNYFINAEGLCDTTGILFSIENIENCGTTEICDNNIDDDGDGLVDCADGDCESSDIDGDGVCDIIDQCQGIDDSLIGTSCDDSNPCTDDDRYVIKDNSTIELSSPLIGITGNTVLVLSQETGIATALFRLDTTAFPEMINLVYVSNECSFYSIINSTTIPTLIKFNWEGHVDVIGPISIPNSEVGYSESLAYNPVADVIYASVSVSGVASYSGSLISLDRNTAEGEILRSIWINSEEGDIDDMVWTDSGIIYHDGDPETDVSNYYKINTSDISSDDIEPTLLLNLPYYANLDLTILNGHLYSANSDKEFYRIDTITKSRVLIGSSHDQEFGGERIGGLVSINGDITCANSFVESCGCEGTLRDIDGDGVCDVDCPLLGLAIGTSCDDGNPDSANDVITVDCLCLGVVSGSAEICDNGVDDDGDGLVDCADNDCCGESSCEREFIDFEITDSECNSNTGKVRIANPDSTVYYFILPSNVSDSPGAYDISFDSLPAGDYFIVALGICDTLELPFTIERFIDCETTEICNNGIDDDGDGLIDCEDGDCSLGITPIVVMDSFCGESNGSISIVDYDSTLQYFLQVDNPTIPDSVIIINTPDGYLDSIPVGSYTLFTSNNCDTNIIENIIIEEIVCKENCDNGIDDDGDGLIDCDDGDCSDTCGAESLPATEICNNNIDDDRDGLIDCEDQSCLIARPFDVTLTKLLDASCPELNNGALTGSGQPMGVMLSLDGINYQEDSTFSNLSPGLYTVTYRDEGGCYEGDSIIIESEKQLSTDLVSVIPATCEKNDGAIIINSEDSTLSYSIDGVFFGSTREFNNLDSGTYTLYVRSEEGCITSTIYEVSTECEEEDLPETEGVTTSDLNIKVMLEGACTPDGLMSTELNDGGYLPGQQPETFFGTSTEAGQPFNQAPWFYEGKEGTKLPKSSSGETIYDSDVVDWVLVSLRGEATKATEVWRGAGLLYYDGTIEFFSPLALERTYGRGYYVVVEHRNHLPVMSTDKVQLVDGVISYDFTAQNSYTSILGVGQIQDDQGRYMMVGGNGELVIELSSDIDINARDLTLWLQNNGANSSYFFEDYDMNGDINIKDRILWEKNNGLFTTFETKEDPKD